MPWEPLPLSSLPQNWRNSSIIKVGAETAVWDDWQWRAGAEYVTRVTPNDRAIAVAVAPSNFWGFSAGVGKHLIDKTLDVNAAFEYWIRFRNNHVSANESRSDRGRLFAESLLVALGNYL